MGDSSGKLHSLNVNFDGYDKQSQIIGLQEAIKVSSAGNYFKAQTIREVNSQAEIIHVQALPDGGMLILSKNGKIWGLDSNRRLTVRGHISLDYKMFRPTNIKPH